MRNMTMWSYFSSSACGDMPNTQNVPYRAHSGCLGGGGSEGGAPIWKGQPCVMVGKWGLSRFTIEPLGWLFLQKRGQGRSRLQERAPWVVVLAETRAEVDGEVDSVLEVS